MRRPRWPDSIRGRLLTGFVVLFVLGLGASGVATAFLVNDYLLDRASDKLRADAGRIEALVATGPQTVQAAQLETLLGPPLGAVGVDADGEVLFGTGSGNGRERELADAAARPGRLVTTDDEVVVLRVETPGLRVALSDARTVDVAGLVLLHDADVDDEALLDFFVAMSRVALLALLVLVGLALVVLRLGLRPLTRMAEAADAIADGRREERIPVSARRSETDVLAAALNRAFDAQSRAESRARAFAADASHELRTPLATVSGWLELYRQGGLRGEALEVAVSRVEEEVGRIRLLVEELGLLARLDTGRPLDREPMDLARVVGSVVEDARIIYAGLRIDLDAPASVPLVGDAARVQQVLHNLVGNAVRHTPDGTRVRLVVHDRGDHVRLQVADDGPGIPSEDLPRLFDRFWRAEESRSRDYGGSGLGLAIVRAIVQAHGGRVEVASEVGVGTTVSVTLPSGTP